MASTKLKKGGTAKNGGKTITKEALIEQANNALASLQPDLSKKFLKRALDLFPDDTNLMDALADVYLQLGDNEKALQLLQRSTQLNPEENPFKWLFLAQLQTNKDALKSYMTAGELIQKLASGSQDPTEGQFYRTQTAKIYCSIAELYMTDLCFELDAEAKCEEAITMSLTIVPDGLDGKQTLANLRLSQCRIEEACDLIDDVFQRLRVIREKEHARTVLEDITETEESSQQDVPEPEFCIATAKYLIECAAHRPLLAESATDLIISLMEDDDENIELWYMMGVAALMHAPAETDSARYHLETAKEMMEKLKEDMKGDEEFPYTCQYDLIEEHLQMLSQDPESLCGSSIADSFRPRKAPAPAAAAGAASMELCDIQEDEEWSTDEDEDGADDNK